MQRPVGRLQVFISAIVSLSLSSLAGLSVSYSITYSLFIAYYVYDYIENTFVCQMIFDEKRLNNTNPKHLQYVMWMILNRRYI